MEASPRNSQVRITIIVKVTVNATNSSLIVIGASLRWRIAYTILQKHAHIKADIKIVSIINKLWSIQDSNL